MAEREPYLGIRKGDLDGKWYAKYFNPWMEALPGHIRDALTLGIQAPPLAIKVAEVPSLADPGYHLMENGFTRLEDGSICVAGLTRMPGITPEMWDWWFSWHPHETQRYKLWHPQAHLRIERIGDEPSSASTYRDRYVGITARITEYVGDSLGRMDVSFLAPSELGFDENALADPQDATAICCRIALADNPLEWGWMVHYIRRTQNGSEMRSRMWMGGEHVNTTVEESALTEEDKAVREGITNMRWNMGRNVLVGHAQEMHHLARFLAYIFDECKVREADS